MGVYTVGMAGMVDMADNRDSVEDKIDYLKIHRESHLKKAHQK